MQASAKEPLLNFLKDDTELRVPAILAATADENGVVHFGPDNNVTLIWSLEILQKMGGVAFSKIEEYGLIDELFPDPMTGAIIKFVIKLGKSYLGSDNMLWDADGNLITNTLTGTEDITKYTITFYSNILYRYMGGNLVYKSELDLAKDMTKYLYAYGRTAQNLLVFGNQVAKKSKAVITGKVDRNWIFYNYSTSLRTNSALKTQKILLGVEQAIDTTDDHPVTTGIKATVHKIIERIDTSNRIIEQTTKIQNAFSSFLSKTVSSIGSTIGDLAAKLVKTIIGWSKL